MTRILRKSWPYVLALFVVFMAPAVGLLIGRFGGGEIALSLKGLFFIALLGINPAASLVAGALAGYRHGPLWLMPVLAALSFLPAALIVYNSSAFVYAIGYAVFAFAGLGLGLALRGRKR